jgi:hypothetical protein
MSSLDAPEMTCRQCKNVHCAFNPICPHCGIGPEGPIIKAPDHRREIIQKTSDGGTVSPPWFRPPVRS